MWGKEPTAEERQAENAALDARELARLQLLALRARDCLNHVEEALEKACMAPTYGECRSHLRGAAHTFIRATLSLIELG